MSGSLYCRGCAKFRVFTGDCRCTRCGYLDSDYAAVKARTTVGAAFVEPLPSDEKLVHQVAAFLYGKVTMRDDHPTQSAAAEDYARNLVQSLILDFDIKPRERT